MKKADAQLLAFLAVAVAAVALLALTPEAAPLPAETDALPISLPEPLLSAAVPDVSAPAASHHSTPRHVNAAAPAASTPLWDSTKPAHPPAAAFSTTPTVPPAAFKTAAASPSTPASGTPRPAAESFEVDAGVPIPASLGAVDPAVGLSEQQAELNRQIAAEFIQAVNGSPDVSAAWKAGQARADARFRKLFGDDLFRAQILNVAREARGVSKR